MALALTGILLFSAPPVPAQTGGADGGRAVVVELVRRIRAADYAGDRAALRRLHRDLAPAPAGSDLAAAVYYWRGFALWRRALNGFNDAAGRAELEADLEGAIVEFERALAARPGFLDARVGIVSCRGNLLFLHLGDAAKVAALVPPFRQAMAEALAEGPDHPRLLWVVGANQWVNPPERGGGQELAIRTYQRGLAAVRAARRPDDPLVPSWGEPELLMNLAYAHLHHHTRDAAAAERYALEALRLVPGWKYVRERLLPDIRRARR